MSPKLKKQTEDAIQEPSEALPSDPGPGTYRIEVRLLRLTAAVSTVDTSFEVVTSAPSRGIACARAVNQIRREQFQLFQPGTFYQPTVLEFQPITSVPDAAA